VSDELMVPDIPFSRWSASVDRSLKAELAAAEARGWAAAVAALRDKDAAESREWDEGVKAHPENWDGWPYAHPYRQAADHLESIGRPG